MALEPIRFVFMFSADVSNCRMHRFAISVASRKSSCIYPTGHSYYACLFGRKLGPRAYGRRAEDAFDLVPPSMPGYGFSGKPQGTGWGPDHIARAWAERMGRLGYTRYVSQGGE